MGRKLKVGFAIVIAKAKWEGSGKGKECVAIFSATFRLMLASFLSSELAPVFVL